VIVAPTTAADGTCAACSSPLASGQRYCIACGERRGELPFRVPERCEPPASPILRRHSFGVVGVVVLASGVLIGAAVGPAITPSSLASTAGQLIVVGTGGEQSQPPQQLAAASGAASTASLSAPTGDVSKPPPVIVNRGAGRSPAPPAAPAATPAAPPASAKTAPAPHPQAPLPPAAPDPDPTVNGTVVHLSHDGHGYAIATKEGQLLALHTDKAPTALGDKLKVTVHALDNGSFDERSTKSLGHADVATFSGTVTFADAQAGTYTVSTRGVSLLVHLPAPLDPSTPPLQPPAVGVQTTVDVGLVPQLQEIKRVDGDPAVGELDLEAIVRDPGPDPTQLIVSADDAGESPSTLALKVPPKVDVTALKPGTVIAALVKRELDGSFTLVSASADS
jgi:hypothetical protein